MHKSFKRKVKSTRLSSEPSPSIIIFWCDNIAELTVLYCIVLYLLLVLNPKSYDGAQVLEASGRPLLVKGRS